MKTIKKYLSVFLCALALAGCEDMLNKVPEGSVITQEQKDQAIANNPALLAADVAAMNANMIGAFAILGSDYHSDFGYAAACMYMDCNGSDMTCANIGYNWFSPNSAYTDRTYTSDPTYFMWSLFYTQIYSANNVIASVAKDATDATLKAYRGQALAIRAFDYLALAQLHQFTYLGHEDKPCVPIVTEETTAEQTSNNPRATVKAVYELIMNDLNEAVTLLKGYKRQDKGYVDQAVAYGLRARANMLMGNYAQAYNDADSALVISEATPYTIEELAEPKFWDANDKTVMWANIITETNDIVTTGIVNMPSHLCSFYTDGYVGVGAWKKINKPLFEKIASTDVRKGWWLDENSSSPVVADAKYASWFATASKDSEFGAYTNVKFGPDNNDLVKLVPAQDWFLMRSEEMILIKAEALAQQNKTAEAKNELENFVKTYRNPVYTAPTSNLIDEIYFQRRIELWGEGFIYYDIMRLKKPVTRVEDGNTSFPAAWQFNIAAEDPILLWLVPQSEIEANDGISESDNNEAVPAPKA